MRFKVTTSGNFYTPADAAKLETLGFRFEDDRHKMRGPGTRYKVGEGVEVELSTLEELIAFSKEWDRLVVSEGEIEIYDDYRE